MLQTVRVEFEETEYEWNGERWYRARDYFDAGRLANVLEALARRDTIRACCATRRIETLVHFTRVENLESILADGLLPRSALKGRAGVIFNDADRYDRHEDAVCLTISFPNYKMFYSYRQRQPNTEWAVLLLRADILWELDCSFCWANAARSAISRLPLELLKHASSLEKMFADQCEVLGVNRSACRIPDCYPTNPQAEVLTFSSVALSYVTGAYFQGEGERRKFLPSRGVTCNIGVKPEYFNARVDWQAWKQVAEANTGESWHDDPSSVPF